MSLNAKTAFELLQPGDIIYHKPGYPYMPENLSTIPMTIKLKFTDPDSFQVESQGYSFITMERVDLTKLPERLKKRNNNNKSRKNRKATRKARKNRRRSSRKN
jgi:hypothetical protein